MTQYHSFLVRVWSGAGRDGEQCVVRVEHLQTAESRRFLSLDELSAHLRAVLGVAAPPREGTHGVLPAHDEIRNDA